MVHGSSFGGAEAACRFLEPELQIESRADVGLSAVGARQLCGSAGIGQLGDGGKKKEKRKRKGAGDNGGPMGLMMTGDGQWCVELLLWPVTEADRRVALRAAADFRRRWEARWKAWEAREKAARARRLAEQDQGSKVRLAQAGPCAACARQGGASAASAGSGNGVIGTSLR